MPTLPTVSPKLAAWLACLEAGEDTAFNGWLRKRVDETFADPRPDVPARKVFKRLRKHRSKRMKAARTEEI